MLYTKHINVMHMLSLVPKDATGRLDLISEDESVALFDKIFRYIHANWVVPIYKDCPDVFEKDVAECNNLLRHTSLEDIEDRLSKLPPVYSEIIFPIAVARMLLGGWYRPGILIHRKLTTFSEFYRRYGGIILEDRDL